MRVSRRLGGLLLAAVVVVTGAATCERHDTFTFTNTTPDTVVVQLMDATGRPMPIATLKAGQQGATNLGGDQQACDTREYRAVTGAGVVVDRVSRECSGQVWSIGSH